MNTDRNGMNRREVLGLAAILILGPGQAMAATEKKSLRWKFKPGEVFRYSIDQKTVSSGQDLEGREIKQTVDLILDMTWTVKTVDAAGVASIIETIDRVRTTMAAPFGKFSFDSREAGNSPGPAGPMVSLLVGAEFAFKMNPRGEAAEITLSEKLLASLKAQAEAAGPQAQFSEVGLKNIIEQMVMPLPPNDVDIGENWTRAIAIPAGPDGQTRKAEEIFTYKGTLPSSPDLDAIEFTTKLDPPKADPNVPITFKKETQIGRIEFDNAAGRVIRVIVEEEVEFSVVIGGKEVAQKAGTTRVLALTKEKTS